MEPLNYLGEEHCVGNIEDLPFTEITKQLTSLENELQTQFLRLKTGFHPVFPPLEQLISDPVAYATTVEALLAAPTQPELSASLPIPTALSVHMALSTDPFCPPTSPEGLLVLTKSLLSTNSSKQLLIHSLHSEMQRTAPNLTQLTGAQTAVKLVTSAGSLEKLSTLPACNIQSLGYSKQNQGYSTMNDHLGHLAECEVLKSAPSHILKKCIRVLAAKAALAARLDHNGSYTDGSFGLQYRDCVLERLEKYIEPPSLSNRKPLPIPEDRPKPKRGGKRIRAAKRKYELTEIRKYSNRVQFGVEEQEVFRDTGHTFGMLGRTGKVRVMKQLSGFKVHNKKKFRKFFEADGTKSCFAFDGDTSLVLDNPARTLGKDVQHRYFDSESGYATVMAERRAGS